MVRKTDNYSYQHFILKTTYKASNIAAFGNRRQIYFPAVFLFFLFYAFYPDAETLTTTRRF